MAKTLPSSAAKETKLRSARGPSRSKQQTQTIRARIQPELKQQAEVVLKRVGLTPSDAIRLFYKQVVLRQGLPFEVKLPNARTREALRAAEAGELTRYASVEDLARKLGT